MQTNQSMAVNPPISESVERLGFFESALEVFDESLAAHPAPRSCGDLFGAGRT
jgi:hypothetical protein